MWTTSTRAALLAAVLAVPALARADRPVTVDATAQTILAGRPDYREGEAQTVIPLLGVVGLRATGARAPGFDEVRVVLSMWGQIDPAEPVDDNHVVGDVDLAYAEGDALRGRLRARVGRQILLGGAAGATPFDGVLVSTRLVGGLGVSAEGGIPVTPRFSIDRGDALAGGRVYYRHSVDAEVGVSYLHMLDDGRVSRQDAGVDARWVPASRVLLGGNLGYSVVETRIAQAQLYAAWDASRRVRIALEGSRTAPDLFLLRNSILSVFAEESRDEAGATVTLRPFGALRLEADGRVLRVEDGEGGRAALRAEWRRPAWSLGGEARGLLLPDDGYLHGRLFGRLRTSARSGGTCDLALYALDEPWNGEHLSATAVVAWGIELGEGWRVLGSGLAGTDPLYQRRFEAMLRVSKDFIVHARRGP